MSKDKKSSKLKQLIGNLLNINDWKLKPDGHLDVTTEELTRLTEEYGPDFVAKFEKLLSEENEDKNSNNQTQLNMPKELKLALLCAILSVESFQAADDGSVTLNKEQLDKIEAGLKKAYDDKAAAESTQATAKTDKEIAESALSNVMKALDELDPTVKAVTDPKAKVEAVRVKLAEKPGAAASLAQRNSDNSFKKIEGADEVNEYVKTLL
jgi:hypothetical protein